MIFRDGGYETDISYDVYNPGPYMRFNADGQIIKKRSRSKFMFETAYSD